MVRPKGCWASRPVGCYGWTSEGVGAGVLWLRRMFCSYQSGSGQSYEAIFVNAGARTPRDDGWKKRQMVGPKPRSSISYRTMSRPRHSSLE